MTSQHFCYFDSRMNLERSRCLLDMWTPREKAGGLAVSVVNIDSEVPEDTIKQIKAVNDVLFAKLLKV